MIEVVEVSEVEADPLNPRRSVPERDEVLGLSLRKFGHVLPMVADAAGTIVSGHQRLRVAKDLGVERVPILRVDLPKDELARGARLMLFNLASADIGDRVDSDTAGSVEALDSLVERLRERDDVDLNDPAAWPCMRAEERDVHALMEANPQVNIGIDSKIDGTSVLARSHKIRLPLVCDREGRLISGKQRLAVAVKSKAETWPTVTTDSDDLLGDVLNLVSMQFDAEPMADVMRASVWLNAMWRRKALGLGFIHWVDRRAHAVEFDLEERIEEWKAVHGSYVADVGAGHMGEAALLNRAGVRCVAFEPFLCVPGEGKPDRDLTRQMTQVFLDDIARGEDFDSVFCSAVLNQVPFQEDRFRVLTLVHALCAPTTIAYVSTLGTHASPWREFESGKVASRPTATDLRIGGSESRTVITSLGSGRVMQQKWHTEEELRHLLLQLWREVDITRGSNTFYARCSSARPRKPGLIRKMIDHEFDLPWGAGHRLGMADAARQAFTERLGIDL